MCDTASELNNDFLGIYFDEYHELSDAKRNKMQPKYDSDNLFIEKNMIMTDLKMKNQLIQQGKVIKRI